MPDAVLTAASVWLVALIGACALATLKLRSRPGRILALDTLSFALVGLLAVRSAAEDAPHFLDAALVIALLGFVATLASTLFVTRGGPFR